MTVQPAVTLPLPRSRHVCWARDSREAYWRSVMTTRDDEDELLRSAALQNASSILIARQRAERRNEAYLAEAQRLSHTGSFGWRPSTGEIIWSGETFRIFQYDRATIPTVELILQRIHPEDSGLVNQITQRASRDGKDFDYECRLAMP